MRAPISPPRWRPGNVACHRGRNTLLDVPIEMTILANGTCQVAENEPVTNRFHRAVRVKDGGLDFSGDRERGTLTLHEAEGRRMLTGRVSQIDGPPYAIYLEAQSATSAAPSPAESGAGDLTGHGRLS